MKLRLPLAIVLAAGLVCAAGALQEDDGTSAESEPDEVARMLEEARSEIREFREHGGQDDDPDHPGRAWAERLWGYREQHPGTAAAARATTEAIHFMLHAGREAEAMARARTLPPEDEAWPTLIGIAFEAAEQSKDYEFFKARARAMLGIEEDPEARARLRFRLAQAHWVEGDASAAETALTELDHETSDAGWRAISAAAREEIGAAAERENGSRRSGRDLWQRPTRLLAALELESGDRVADVGSGQGYFTFHLARRVGSKGRVFAVDIEERPLTELGARAEALGMSQIETVLGALDDPKLPAGELRAIVVVDAYHEMRDYQPMMAAMADALAPGGRLAIVDIPAELGKERTEYHDRHRIPAEWVIREAADAGLRLYAFDRDFVRQPGGRRLYLVVLEKPAPGG